MKQFRLTRVSSVLVVFLFVMSTLVASPVVASASSSRNSAPLVSASAGSGSAQINTQLPSILNRAQKTGNVPPTTPMSFNVVLSLRNTAQLNQLLQNLYNPASPQYHQFLTRQQFNQVYGPDTSEVSALSSYFGGHGLQVSSGSNPNIVTIHGTVQQIEASLKTQIAEYTYNGSSFYSPVSPATLPSQFSNINSISGLSNYAQSQVPVAVPQYKTLGQTVNPSLNSGNFIYYSPSEIRQAYNATGLLNAGYNGTGESIGIVDAFGDPYIGAELGNFSAQFGIKNTSISVICVDGPCDYTQGLNNGWNGEIALDVEWAHAMAPGAHINLYIASGASYQLYDAVYAAVLGGNNIVSMSWAQPENDFATSIPIDPQFGPNYPWVDQVFQFAAAVGVTSFASSGDQGAYDQGSPIYQQGSYGSAVFPATDPFVTGVGGTSLYMNTTSGYTQFPYANATGSYGNETAWSWDNMYGWGTGGGYSSFFAQPSWQTGPGVQNNGARGAPDVSWDADVQTGVLVSLCNTGCGTSSAQYSFEIFGGTSVGSPSWAGSIADLDQRNGFALGYLNPTIYSILNNNSEYSKAFHDVTVGNNAPYSATKGWDPLTGVGTPNLGMLANYIAPNGAISVAVQSDLSSYFSQSYSYGSIVNLTAAVWHGLSKITTATVTANITSPTGALIAKNLALRYNSVSTDYNGSYLIKSTDPSGEWSVNVHAVNDTTSGNGYTQFSVGDGVSFAPRDQFGYYTTGFQRGDTIFLAGYITSPDGITPVTGGTFNAVFTLNSPGGKVEGTAPMYYNSTSDQWMGNFTVPNTADQGQWVVSVQGTDSSGNKGNAYTWLTIGLLVDVYTDLSSYVLGDTISIMTFSGYPDIEAYQTNGTATATITAGSGTVGTVNLKYNNEQGRWLGSFKIPSNAPTGFYTITAVATDTNGNSGSFFTTVRVAPYHLNVRLSFPTPTIPVNGNITYAKAAIALPSNSPVTIGSVEGWLYFNAGGGISQSLGRHFGFTYNASSHAWIAPEIFTGGNLNNTLIGKYSVVVQAYDISGNYGNATSYFTVSGTNHAAISITNASGFDLANGVIGGTGTLFDPYVIGGWNTSSISIVNTTMAVNYEILNNYISGSSSNGITLNTPDSPSATVINNSIVHSSRNGILANNTYGVLIGNNVVGYSGQNGIWVNNDTSGPEVAGGAEYNNAWSGVSITNSSGPLVDQVYSINNGKDGIFVSSSFKPMILSDEVDSNTNGIHVIGPFGTPHSNGTATIQYDFGMLNTNAGVYIDGSGVKNVTNYSDARVLDGEFDSNSIGLESANMVNLYMEYTNFYDNGVGVSSTNSANLIQSIYVASSGGNGIYINGQTFQTLLNEPWNSMIEGSSFIFNGNRTTNTGSGISVNNANYVLTSNNYVYSSGANGIEMNNSNNSKVLDNRAYNNGLSGFSGTHVGWTKFDGNLAQDNTKAGLSIMSGMYNEFGLNDGNTFLNNANGMVLSGGKYNLVSYNEANYNAYAGFLLSGGEANSSIDYNSAFGNVNGYVVSGANENYLGYNEGGNSTGTGSTPGFGVLLTGGSSLNGVFENYLYGNDAGIGFNNSQSNQVTNNYVGYNTVAGLWFNNGAQNSYSGNELFANEQNIWPAAPVVSFTSPSSGSAVSGTVPVAWTATGSISSEALTIDGSTVATSGASYSWNTTSVVDGSHIIQITVTNSGGFSASAQVIVTTNMQIASIQQSLSKHFLSVQTVAPGGTPLTGSSVKVSNSSYSRTLTTGSDGFVQLQLAAGTYSISTTINGTLLEASADLISNVTVVLEPPTLQTSAAVTGPNGQVAIGVSGNITASQMTNIQFVKNANGTYSLSFTVTGQTGTVGTATITVPKSQVPNGFIPNVLIDGQNAATQSYAQDANNYYVTFSTHFSTHQVTIAFNPKPTSLVSGSALLYIIVAIVAVAVVAGGLFLVMRRRRQTF